jgi:hypothetical protein
MYLKSSESAFIQINNNNNNNNNNKSQSVMNDKDSESINSNVINYKKKMKEYALINLY